MPPGRIWRRDHPFAWLGILAQVAPSTDELIYAWHPRGFAMHSMRSHEVSRLYLQVDPSERVEDWSDDRVWDELQTRLGAMAGTAAALLGAVQPGVAALVAPLVGVLGNDSLAMASVTLRTTAAALAALLLLRQEAVSAQA